MIDDATLERGLRARPPADPAYRSRLTETPPPAIRPRLTGVRRTQSGWTRWLLAATRLVAVIAVVSLGAFLLSVGGGPSPVPSPVLSPQPSALPTPNPVDDLLKGFLEARLAGAGAEEFLLPVSGDSTSLPPLLYTTSSGEPYDRAEFEPMPGKEWPYGWTAFMVRLFAGDTAVEQLLFWSADDPLRLMYNQHGFGTEIAPTTEDGQPVASEYRYFDGAVTVRAAHPWVMSDHGVIPFGRLIPEGDVRPTTDGGERHDWDHIFLMADPAWVGTDCQTGPQPGAAEAHAEALAESIQADPGLEATSPIAVSAGGYEGLMMDVRIAAGSSVCWNVDEVTYDPSRDPGILYPLWGMGSATVESDTQMTGPASGDWMRLYLFDVPATSGIQWLSIAIVAPESQFERAAAAALPLVDSIEVHPPAPKTPRPTPDPEVTALVAAFLQARIDGVGAEEFVDLAEDDQHADERVDRAIPLLYATSSGAPYERSEFELVAGPESPGGPMQFEVRLFAADDETVVEQVFTVDRDETGRPRLVHDLPPGGPDTTEDGKAVPVAYDFLDGDVTYRAAFPLEPSRDGYRERDRLAIAGLLPDDGAPRRILLFLADPRPIGSGCVAASAPADAESLARSIGSDPDFDATAPAAVTVGGMAALQMDVRLAPGASSCPWSELETSATSPLLLDHAPIAFGADRARLYLADLPEGSEARVLAIATITDEDSFETVLGWAAPVLDSIELHAR